MALVINNLTGQNGGLRIGAMFADSVVDYLEGSKIDCWLPIKEGETYTSNHLLLIKTSATRAGDSINNLIFCPFYVEYTGVSTKEDLVLSSYLATRGDGLIQGKEILKATSSFTYTYTDFELDGPAKWNNSYIYSLKIQKNGQNFGTISGGKGDCESNCSIIHTVKNSSVFIDRIKGELIHDTDSSTALYLNCDLNPREFYVAECTLSSSWDETTLNVQFLFCVSDPNTNFVIYSRSKNWDAEINEVYALCFYTSPSDHSKIRLHYNPGYSKVKIYKVPLEIMTIGTYEETTETITSLPTSVSNNKITWSSSLMGNKNNRIVQYDINLKFEKDINVPSQQAGLIWTKDHIKMKGIYYDGRGTTEEWLTGWNNGLPTGSSHGSGAVTIVSDRDAGTLSIERSAIGTYEIPTCEITIHAYTPTWI